MLNSNHADYPRELLETHPDQVSCLCVVFVSVPRRTIENEKIEKVALGTKHLIRVLEAIRYEMKRLRSTPEAVVSIHILDVRHRHNGFYQLYGMADNKRSVGEMNHQAGLRHVSCEVRLEALVVVHRFGGCDPANGIELTFCKTPREDTLTSLSTCRRASVGLSCLKRIFYRAVGTESTLCS